MPSSSYQHRSDVTLKYSPSYYALVKERRARIKVWATLGGQDVMFAGLAGRELKQKLRDDLCPLLEAYILQCEKLSLDNLIIIISTLN